MEIHKLQDKAQDLREVFTELNNVSVHHFIHLLLLLLSSSSSSSISVSSLFFVLWRTQQFEQSPCELGDWLEELDRV